jgi:hypothetical protein
MIHQGHEGRSEILCVLGILHGSGVRQILGFDALAGFACMSTNRLKAKIQMFHSFTQNCDAHPRMGVRQILGFDALAGFACMSTNRLKAKIQMFHSFTQNCDAHLRGSNALRGRML